MIPHIQDVLREEPKCLIRVVKKTALRKQVNEERDELEMLIPTCSNTAFPFP